MGLVATEDSLTEFLFALNCPVKIHLHPIYPPSQTLNAENPNGSVKYPVSIRLASSYLGETGWMMGFLSKNLILYSLIYKNDIIINHNLIIFFNIVPKCKKQYI